MFGLSLTGGGARGAYQAGVVKGIAEILQPRNCGDDPFAYFAGISAGSINTTYCAASADNFYTTAINLAKMWESIEPKQIYRTDAASLGRIGFGWLRDVSLGTLVKKKLAKELLDARPLMELLRDNIDFDNIERKIASGKLKGVTCSALDYSEQKVVSFVQGDGSFGAWRRPRRYSEATELNVLHVLASCAIPLLFSPVNLGDAYYGDGTLRNTAPVSPILHMGCSNVIFVGVRYGGDTPVAQFTDRPTIARVFGTVLNGLFFDTLDVDMTRLQQVNKLVAQSCDSDSDTHETHINHLYIRPSESLAKFAEEASKKSLPRLVKYLLGGLGDSVDTAELASYLLFDGAYTKKLVSLGYKDAMAKKDEIIEFWARAKEAE